MNKLSKSDTELIEYFKDRKNEFLKSVLMPQPGCEFKTDCCHFYDKVKKSGRILKREICVRFENWPDDLKQQIADRTATCLCFVNRNDIDSWHKSITDYREYADGIFDIDKLYE